MHLPNVQVISAPGCPRAAETLEMVSDVMRAFDLPRGPVHTVASSGQETDVAVVSGAPVVRVDGARAELPSPAPIDAPAGGSGETAERRRGAPPRWLVEAMLLHALSPKGYLFMCVANSARSQIAEGLARRLMPRDVFIQSAGSEPTRIRPEALQVLEEVGIDASEQYSKSVDDIDASRVEVVVTLCAEEVCPFFPGKVLRVHWGLPDPAAVTGDTVARLEAFRATRDELERRIAVLCGRGVSRS